ncbi:MAG: hypothetical protein ACR2ND_08660, partial [Solirubrobacteraceae bacterium]
MRECANEEEPAGLAASGAVTCDCWCACSYGAAPGGGGGCFAEHHCEVQRSGSVEQVQVTGTAPGARLGLVDRRGRRVALRAADSLGGLVFRGVKPGVGYTVRAGRMSSAALRVLSKRSAPPSTRIYNQTIPASGYGYLTTRDGTQLAIDVHLPS